MSTNSTPVAVVTGAGSGIGAATAQRFAREGWDVVLIGRRRQALEDIARTMGSKGFVVPMDLSDSNSLETAKEWTAKNPSTAHRISALIHNAGIYEQALTLDSTDASWHAIFETNVFAVIRLTQALYPFLKLNRGSVTTVSSTLGLRPTANTPAYSASKAALINWGHSFAKEVAHDGVRVNCVCPGVVDTPIHAARPNQAGTTPMADPASIVDPAVHIRELMKTLAPLHPLGRVGQPDEVANMIWALSGPGSDWTTGAVVTVDGGINLV